jgi:hypothetical protein
MPFIIPIDITTPETNFPPEDAIPVLNLLNKEARDNWIPRLIRAKRPFAIASMEAISREEVTRLAETCKRRKLPVAILNAFRLIPVFARLREVVVSGCLGTIEAVQVHFPPIASPVLCADLALWLLPTASAEVLSTAGDNRVTVAVTGSNGSVYAMLDMNARNTSLTVCIGETSRTIIVPPITSGLMAERDILTNTLPAAHRWPLLMHVDDTASAIAMAEAYVANAANGKK